MPQRKYFPIHLLLQLRQRLMGVLVLARLVVAQIFTGQQYMPMQVSQFSDTFRSPCLLCVHNACCYGERCICFEKHELVPQPNCD